jgi:hypothetical protein
MAVSHFLHSIRIKLHHQSSNEQLLRDSGKRSRAIQLIKTETVQNSIQWSRLYHRVVNQGSKQDPKADLPAQNKGPLSFYQQLVDFEPPGQWPAVEYLLKLGYTLPKQCSLSTKEKKLPESGFPWEYFSCNGHRTRTLSY